MRRKVRSTDKKNTPKKNEANTPPKATTSLTNEKKPVKTSTTSNKLSTSETPTGRQIPSRAHDDPKKTVTPSENVPAATATPKKGTTFDNSTQTKNPTQPKKVILAKKAIVAMTSSAAVKKDKILTKEKMVKATDTTRTNLNIKLPIQGGKSKVCSLSLDYFGGSY